MMDLAIALLSIFMFLQVGNGQTPPRPNLSNSFSAEVHVIVPSIKYPVLGCKCYNFLMCIMILMVHMLLCMVHVLLSMVHMLPCMVHVLLCMVHVLLCTVHVLLCITLSGSSSQCSTFPLVSHLVSITSCFCAI